MKYRFRASRAFWRSLGKLPSPQQQSARKNSKARRNSRLLSKSLRSRHQQGGNFIREVDDLTKRQRQIMIAHKA